MTSTGLSNCFTEWLDKRICGNLIHDSNQVETLISDVRLPQSKRTELQTLNAEMEKFIADFNKKNVDVRGRGGVAAKCRQNAATSNGHSATVAFFF